MTPDTAHVNVEQAVLTGLQAAWERGLDTAPHSANALADRYAPDAYETIMNTIAAYVLSVSRARERAEETRRRNPDVRPAARNGDLVTFTDHQAFQLDGRHPMRASVCPVCQEPFGGKPVMLLGNAALTGTACDTGAVPGETLLIHANHDPVDRVTLDRIITKAMTCEHPWS